MPRRTSRRADALEALWRSGAWHRAVWEAASDAMALSDPEGTVLAANPAYHRLYGYPAEEVIGRSFAVIFPEEHRPWAVSQYREVFASPTIAPAYEAVVHTRSGDERIVEARYDFVTQDGERIAMLSIVRDITERKRAEQLQRDFVAMVGHDLRTPLATIKGHAQRMLRRQEYSETGTRAILSQVDRQESLLSDLLDVAQMETGQLRLRRERVDVVALVQRLTQQAATLGESHPIQIEAPPRPLVGRWDPTRLEQIVHNMLSNAIKYSPEGRAVWVRVAAVGQEARVSVADQGSGIAPEVLPRIFDRFYRAASTARDAQGTGLGLYITRSLVEAHGGRIWAESEPGRGSTFTFALPLDTNPILSDQTNSPV